MHYDGLLRSNVATPIITDKITGQSIGVNRKMSKIDIQKLNQMYPCIQSTVPPTVPPTIPPTVLSKVPTTVPTNWATTVPQTVFGEF